jgi:hypothetical protein
MSLAEDQAALVAALVAGAALPDGFDAERVRVAREALLRKRAGEVAMAWPVLAASVVDPHSGGTSKAAFVVDPHSGGTSKAAFVSPQWTVEFREWARDRPTAGSYRDGLEFARFLDEAGRLPEAARPEFRARTVTSAGRWWRSTTQRWSSRLRRAR